MEDGTGFFIRGYEHLTPDERHRAVRADAVYDSVFQDVRLKLDAFQKMPAWVEFVDGLIEEEDLWSRVQVEKEQALAFLTMAA